jgi:outer membrane immunogenic protein
MLKIRNAIAIAATLLGFSSIAVAADLPTHKEAPPPPAPVEAPFSWTGFYLGGYAGGAFGSARAQDVLFPGFVNGNHFTLDGFTGGGLAGFNYQFSSFVIGAEGEFGFDGLRKGQDYTTTITADTLRHEELEENWIGRIRGRAGYAWNNLLIFGAGGVSFTDARLTFVRPFNGFTDSETKTYTGFNIGGGVEYAFTRNWIGRVEYIYDQFDNQTFAFPPGGFDARQVNFHENTVRAALEYKFW